MDASTHAVSSGDSISCIGTLTMSGGTGTRTRLGKTHNSGEEDAVGQLASVVETLDLTNRRERYSEPRVAGDGDLTLTPLSSNIHVDVTNSQLAPLQPYAAQMAAIEPTSGQLSMKGTLELSPGYTLPRILSMAVVLCSPI